MRIVTDALFIAVYPMNAVEVDVKGSVHTTA